MISAITPAIGPIALSALPSCVETGAAPSMATAPGSAPFIEGMLTASEAAVTACRDLLASQNDSSVTVVGSEFSQANSAVYMRVGANGAPWKCIVSDDGSNQSVEFQGSEGSL